MGINLKTTIKGILFSKSSNNNQVESFSSNMVDAKEDTDNNTKAIKTQLTDCIEELARKNSYVKLWGGYLKTEDKDCGCLTERYWMKSSELLKCFGLPEKIVWETDTLVLTRCYDKADKPCFCCTTLFIQLDEKHCRLNCEGLFKNLDDDRYIYESEILTDDSGKCSGIKIIEKDSKGNSRECSFDPNGNLIKIQDTENPSYGDDFTVPQTSLIKRFDTEGNIIEWKEWSYLPEDCLGWSWFLTEFDAHGNVVFKEYRGQA